MFNLLQNHNRTTQKNKIKHSFRASILVSKMAAIKTMFRLINWCTILFKSLSAFILGYYHYLMLWCSSPWVSGYEKSFGKLKYMTLSDAYIIISGVKNVLRSALPKTRFLTIV